jgi:hypothetical protein
MQSTYDGKKAVGDVLAALYGFSPKNDSKVTEKINEVKNAGVIPHDAKRPTKLQKIAIYQWHIDRVKADQLAIDTAQTTLEILPVVTLSIESSQPAKKWGGKREKAGRKPTGCKTTIVRINTELLPVIELLKNKYKRGIDIKEITAALKMAL